MFAKRFETAPPRYYLPSERGGIPDGIGVDALYNAYLVTPPRIYAEELHQPGAGLVGVYAKKEATADSLFTIHLLSWVNMIYWPGSMFGRHWWFDGMTGALLGTADETVPAPLATSQVIQARDGGLWAFTGDVYELNPDTFEQIAGTTYTPADFGATLFKHPPLIDRATDALIVNSDLEAANELGVYSLASGANLRRIGLSGAPAQIFPEDATRCYVISADGMLNLVDYDAGNVMSTLRAPGIEAGAVAYLYAWDRFLRRLLVFTQRDNDTDGACLSTCSGYYPVPLGVGMTPPIALRAPRANRRTPFLCKVYGDAGEPVAGVKITPSAGTSQVVGAPPFTDGDGEAIITLLPAAPGSDTLDITADV